MLALIQTIAARRLDDGLVFDTARATAEVIRDENIYSGVRVTLGGHLAVARLMLHVDVNVGEPIWPAPMKITLPRLLSGQLVVTGYPLAMVRWVLRRYGRFLDGYPALAQRRWSAWRRKHRLDDRLPQDFAAVLDRVIAFADPALTGAARESTWVAAGLTWTIR